MQVNSTKRFTVKFNLIGEYEAVVDAEDQYKAISEAAEYMKKSFKAEDMKVDTVKVAEKKIN